MSVNLIVGFKTHSSVYTNCYADMKNYRDQLNVCKNLIEKRLSPLFNPLMDDASDLYAAAQALSALLPKEYMMFKNRLDYRIIPNLRIQQTSLMYGTPSYCLSPIVFGELISTIEYLSNMSENIYHGIDWSIIHPEVVRVSRERFDAEQYADAVEAAFKMINNSVKRIVKTKVPEEVDGVQLMQKAFNKDNPLIPLNDLVSRTDKDIQQGYQFMFAGAISGIRNPKAHDVESISIDDAIRKLYFASMLMYKLDGRKKE